MKKIRVLLVDDHAIVMDGVAALLVDSHRLEVAGKASSTGEALLLVERVRPDAVITDISLGGPSGIDLTRTLAASHPLLPVVVLTMHEEPERIAAAFEAGARAYLLKNARGAELIEAVEKVVSGGTYLQAGLGTAWARYRDRQAAGRKESLLTPREVEVGRLIAEGRTTAEISGVLHLSEYTVETHRKNIVRKTGARSPLALVTWAKEKGLL